MHYCNGILVFVILHVNVPMHDVPVFFQSQIITKWMIMVYLKYLNSNISRILLKNRWSNKSLIITLVETFGNCTKWLSFRKLNRQTYNIYFKTRLRWSINVFFSTQLSELEKEWLISFASAKSNAKTAKALLEKNPNLAMKKVNQ